MGGSNNEIKLEHIHKLDYLDRCAKESMRLFTVTPWIGRSINEEVQLSELYNILLKYLSKYNGHFF